MAWEEPFSPLYVWPVLPGQLLYGCLHKYRIENNPSEKNNKDKTCELQVSDHDQFSGQWKNPTNSVIISKENYRFTEVDKVSWRNFCHPQMIRMFRNNPGTTEARACHEVEIAGAPGYAISAPTLNPVESL